MEAAYLIDKATMVDARRALHGPRTLLARAGFLIVGAMSALLVIFGLGSTTARVYVLVAISVGFGLRFGVPALIGRTLDQATDGVGKMWITLTIRPDGLQVNDGFVVSLVGWHHLIRYRKSDDYLLLTARGRGDVIAPRHKLPPLFEANLERILQANGTSAEPPAPDPSLLLRGLQGILVLSLLFLLLCVVIVLAVGGPKHERIGTCPDGQVAIVTHDVDRNITTLCQYRLDS